MPSLPSPRRGARFGILAALVLGLSLLFTPFVSAQSTPVPGADVTRTITVNGTGTVKVDPDTARIDLGVVANNESLDAAQTEVTKGLTAINQVLSDAGIAPEDVTTTSYNVYPVPKYDRDGNYVGVERYEVSAGISVVVRDIDSVGTILDAAVEGGANNVWGISFYVDDTSSAASQARQAAVEDARTKADELATSSGMVVTNVVSIVETSSPDPKSELYAAQRGAGDMAMEQASVPVPVSPGQTEIRVDVQIVFEVEQAAG